MFFYIVIKIILFFLCIKVIDYDIRDNDAENEIMVIGGPILFMKLIAISETTTQATYHRSRSSR